ncbi:MAG: glycoside hydrolase family 3 N-terminal domain-containing protein [Pseudanabaenaceae cyanobacterium bins.68]|nr:glycoside hydrolase family 3 N-terminal domain-containing protein [Pseudanabaenaceae cyanobacterium bins.68]
MNSNIFDLDHLSLEAQIAQMIVVRASGSLSDRQILYPQWEANYDQLSSWIQELGIGGVILMGGTAAEVAWRTAQLQALSQIPLLIAADLEEGVGQRFAGATWFLPPFACLTTKDAADLGRVTAAEALEIGINWLLAPVADVNNNPQNPVINIRAFGDRPDWVAKCVAAFIGGAKSYPVLTTAKHFPGHGDTAIDSHLDLPVLTHGRSRFGDLEFVPFQAAIAAGVDSIMTAHVLALGLDSGEIATLSGKILSGILRQELGFEGLIVSDALNMAGIAQRYSLAEVAIKAVLAGVDILLMPANPVVVIKAIAAAVRSQVIPVSRIKAALTRICQAKTKVGQPRPLAIPQVGTFPNWQLAEDLAQRSLKSHLVWRLPQGQAFTQLIVVERLQDVPELCLGNQSAWLKQWGANPLVVDLNLLAKLDWDSLGAVLLQVFSRGNPWRGGMSAQIPELVTRLLQAQQLQAIALFGSPYALDRVLALVPETLPWVFSYGQQPYAQAIALAKLFDQIYLPA